MKTGTYIVILWIFMILGNPSVQAQNWEVGMMGGGSYYYGDVVNEFHQKDIRYGTTFFLRKRVDNNRSIRISGGYIRIIGLDSLSDSKFQRGRNLNFFTDIYETSFLYEYNLKEDNIKDRKNRNRLIPYVYGGAGLMYFVPQTVVNGKVYNLAKLQTSGINYSQVALIIPLGAGIRYRISPRWQIGLEAGLRITGTSDLDDIRGNSLYPDPVNLPNDDSRLVYDRANQPKNPDTGIGYGKPGRIRGKLKWQPDCYMLLGITLTYRMGQVEGNCFGKSGCPRFF
jgi:hypothetical protein